MKKVIIAGFIIFGTAVGLAAVWFRQNTDTVFLLNISGTLLGDAVYSGAIKLLGDPYSPQAHYTVPWLFRIPQVYVPASLFFWGVTGTLLAILLRPKVVAITMGLYLLVLGIIPLLVATGV